MQSLVLLLKIDLENDRIRIQCDDDLKFFLEESACHKVIFDFNPTSEVEMSRKRNCSEVNEATDGSKRLRKQLSQIDLSSDLSSMETDDDEIDEIDEIFSCSASTSVSDFCQDYNQGASTSQAAFAIPSTSEPKSEPNVTIISQHVLGTSVEPKTFEIPDENASEIVSIDDNASIIDDNANDVQVVAESAVQETVPKEQSVQQNSSARQGSTNRILISDSSDDEAQDTNTNRRHSEGFSSAYAYANINGDRFESGSSFRQRRHFSRRGHGHARGYHHPHSFQEQLRRQHSENMDRFHEQARLARDRAARAVRASTSMIPDLVSQFQFHFRRPLFRVADINQHIFGTYSGGR